jgi:hypothetical protein
VTSSKYLTTSIALVLLLTGCRVIINPASPTEEPTPQPTATATIEWFPATQTPTPFPTPDFTPTPNYRPNIGELIFEDDFSDPSLWTTDSSGDGEVTVSGGNIHLSLNARRSYLFSTRTAPILGDFYAVVRANARICSGEDEYGLIVRNTEDGDHYRFALSCDGRAKVDRYQGGSLSRQTGWVTNRAIPEVVPGNVRLAVWAQSGQLNFFVNDLYLFSVNDTQFYRGTIGVFAHTSGDGDVSVDFAELGVWDISN